MFSIPLLSFTGALVLSFTRNQCWNKSECSPSLNWLGWTDHILSTQSQTFLLAVPPLLAASNNSWFKTGHHATRGNWEMVTVFCKSPWKAVVCGALGHWHWCSRSKQKGAPNIQTNGINKKIKNKKKEITDMQMICMIRLKCQLIWYLSLLEIT